MNYRSAAREIVMLAIPQLPKDEEKFSSIDFEKIILSLVRSLGDYAKKNISTVIADLNRIEKFLNNSEIEHPDNEKHTTQIKPVLIPDTAVLKNQVELLKQAATDLHSALELPEIIEHTEQSTTLEYAREIFNKYINNKEKINEIIENAAMSRKESKKWKIDRMVRLDRDILRISTIELMYFTDTPIEVICDEAVKIAEKYGGNESKKFVNGVLRDIVELTRKQPGEKTEV